MAQTKEQSIQRALDEFEKGLFSSLRKAANHHGVPRTTLSYRLRGRRSTAEADRKSQRLSKDEERALVRYFQDLQRQDQCPDHPKMHSIVTRFLRNKGDENRLGKNYLTRLVSRHSELKAGGARSTGAKRPMDLDTDAVERFWAEFERLRTDYNIEIQDVYSMEEAGFQIEKTADNYVICNLPMGHPETPATGNIQRVSIIECIGVDRAMKPYIVFAPKAPDDHIPAQDEDASEVIWALQPHGWTEKELAVDWLQRIFVPRIWRPDKHSILILNNHDRYTTGEFQYHCLHNNIHPLYLPALASQKLQPLNVGPSSPLSAAFEQAVRDYSPDGREPVDQTVFIKLYLSARQTTLTERNIRAGWERAGIWQHNQQKALDGPEQKSFNSATPAYQPPPVKQGPIPATPKKVKELRKLISRIEATITPRKRRAVRMLGDAAIQAHMDVLSLRREIRELRRKIRDQEINEP